MKAVAVDFEEPVDWSAVFEFLATINAVLISFRPETGQALLIHDIESIDGSLEVCPLVLRYETVW